jgi:hypothetical protein
MGAQSFGVSFGLASTINRSASAASKTNAWHNAAFAILSLHLKNRWNFSGEFRLNFL